MAFQWIARAWACGPVHFLAATPDHQVVVLYLRRTHYGATFISNTTSGAALRDPLRDVRTSNLWAAPLAGVGLGLLCKRIITTSDDASSVHCSGFTAVTSFLASLVWQSMSESRVALLFSVAVRGQV